MIIYIKLLKSIDILQKKRLLTTALLSILFISPICAQLPTAAAIASEMGVGWNIGNSLEVPYGETGWDNPIVNQELIDAVSDAGFNTIRIPCSWDSHADQSTLEINTDWLNRVGEVIDYCYANDMYVIINVHWDGGWLENNVTTEKQTEVNNKQDKYWTQIAEHFEDYDEHLLFASANEPNVDNAAQMEVLMSYHQTFVNAVRATGGNNSSRVLVIQGPSTDIDKTNRLMSSMPEDTIEDRLMAEVHYYTPWNFCGLENDADWGSMFFFWGKDFHSTTNTSRNANWGEESAVESYFKSMKTKFVDKGIPVILGEYGAIKRTNLTGEDLDLHVASREFYYEYVTNAAIRNGLIPYYWDNGHDGQNGYALFDRANGNAVDQGALDAIIQGYITSVEEDYGTESSSPVEFINAYPNPASSSTNLQLNLRKNSQVNISVFNILGERVAHFNDLNINAGISSVNWSIGDLSNGIYFIKANIGREVLTKKLLVVRQ